MHSAAAPFHVALIGPNGAIGRACLAEIFRRGTMPTARFTLLSRQTERSDGPKVTRGLLADQVSTLRDNDLIAYDAQRFLATSCERDLKGADLVIVVAAATVPQETKDAFRRIDPSGRLVNAYANLGMIRDLGEKLETLAPRATALIVTNQTDLLARAMRETSAPTNNILGYGGSLDTARYRFLYAQAALAENEAFSLMAAKPLIVGFHTDDMIVLERSLPEKTRLAPEILETLLQQTRSYGLDVSLLQKDPGHPDRPARAVAGPARDIVDFIAAFVTSGNAALTCMNACVRDPALAAAYGIAPGDSISLPLDVTQGKVEPSLTAPRPTAAERPQLAAASARMTETYARLAAGAAPNP